MPQTLTGFSQVLNPGSSVAASPAQTLTDKSIATMENLKTQAPTALVPTASFVINGLTGALIKGVGITSSSRTAAGKYLVNLSTPAADVNYVVVSNVKANTTHVNFIVGQDNASVKTTTQFGLTVTNGGSTTAVDVLEISGVVFGGAA